MIRKIILTAMVAASYGSIATPATAAIVVQIAPPPPRTEAPPPPRRGHVWVGGHWEWKNRHHQWVRGTWIRERRAYQYIQPTWAERDGRWYMERGNWRRGDRDVTAFRIVRTGRRIIRIVADTAKHQPGAGLPPCCGTCGFLIPANAAAISTS